MMCLVQQVGVAKSRGRSVRGAVTAEAVSILLAGRSLSDGQVSTLCRGGRSRHEAGFRPPQHMGLKGYR